MGRTGQILANVATPTPQYSAACLHVSKRASIDGLSRFIASPLLHVRAQMRALPT